MKRANPIDRSRDWLRILGLLAALLVSGCVRPRHDVRDPLAQRVIPDMQPAVSADSMVRLAAAARPSDGQNGSLPPALEPNETLTPRAMEAATMPPPGVSTGEGPSGRPLTLSDAIALGFRRQPRL